MMRYLLAALLLCLFSVQAQARHVHHHAGHHFKHYRVHHDGLWRHRSIAHRHHYRRIRVASLGGGGGTQMVAHPAGCPSRAFCGCGAAVRLFGSPIRSLWLAANWLRFPRAEPGPNMAAVRMHHVMIIIAYHGNGRATVYDANSGHHQTRIHDRSLAGYRIVNPHRAG